MVKHSPLAHLHYWWSLSLAGALLLVLGPPVLLFSRLAGHKEWVYPLATLGARVWLRLSGMKVAVNGREQLDPRETYIFVCNHYSYLDTAAIFAYAGRRIGLLAKKELLKLPILGYGMGFVNVLAIDRTNHESASRTLQAATRRIQSGISFAVFAEGTRARPGELLPFKKGAFYMAVETKVPVVPVAIRNTDMLMGKNTGLAQGGVIELIFLRPIPSAGLSSDEDVLALATEVRARIARELGVPSS